MALATGEAPGAGSPVWASACAFPGHVSRAVAAQFQDPVPDPVRLLSVEVADARVEVEPALLVDRNHRLLRRRQVTGLNSSEHREQELVSVGPVFWREAAEVLHQLISNKLSVSSEAGG